MPKLEYINTIATSSYMRIEFRIGGAVHHLDIDLAKPEQALHGGKYGGAGVSYPRAEALVQDLERLLTELELKSMLDKTDAAVPSGR